MSELEVILNIEDKVSIGLSALLGGAFCGGLGFELYKIKPVRPLLDILPDYLTNTVSTTIAGAIIGTALAGLWAYGERKKEAKKRAVKKRTTISYLNLISFFSNKYYVDKIKNPREWNYYGEVFKTEDGDVYLGYRNTDTWAVPDERYVIESISNYKKPNYEKLNWQQRRTARRIAKILGIEFMTAPYRRTCFSGTIHNGIEAELAQLSYKVTFAENVFNQYLSGRKKRNETIEDCKITASHADARTELFPKEVEAVQ